VGVSALDRVIEGWTLVYEIDLRPVGWLGYCRWAWNADDPTYRLPAQISLFEN